MKNRVLEYFGRGRWLQIAASYIAQPGKIKQLLQSVKKFTEKDGSEQLLSNIKLLGRYVTDVTTRRYTAHNGNALLLVIAGLIYFVTPTDFIPDFIVGGLFDDLTIVLYIVKTIGKELEHYKEHLNHHNIA